MDTHKTGPAYYRAILADSGADAARAAVVDDSVVTLDWARACGLETFHFAKLGETSGDHVRIHSLAELGALLGVQRLR